MNLFLLGILLGACFVCVVSYIYLNYTNNLFLSISDKNKSITFKKDGVEKTLLLEELYGKNNYNYGSTRVEGDGF